MNTIRLYNREGTHDKYYIMDPDENGKTFTAYYGRIGKTRNTKTYSMSEWYKKYNEKVRVKGYTDYSSISLVPGTVVISPDNQRAVVVWVDSLGELSARIEYENGSVCNFEMRRLGIAEINTKNPLHRMSFPHLCALVEKHSHARTELAQETSA